MKILIVDDDKISRMLLKKQLEKLRYDVYSAENGKKAWSLIKKEKFSIVISDWMMPEMNGMELLKKIRNRKTDQYIYFILLTAKQDTQDLIQGLESGADDYIRKPFHKDELRARVNSGERIVVLEKYLLHQNAQLSALNEKMVKDLEAAATIQRSLLPSKAPDCERYDIQFNYAPSEQLGGDTLNIMKLDDTHYGIYLLDVSGHGVAAALLAFTLNRMLSVDDDQSLLYYPKTYEFLPKQIRHPVDVIEALNQRFQLSEIDQQYFTIIYGVLDISTNTFKYVSAGHSGIIHMDERNQAHIYHSTGLAIGFCPDCEFETQKIVMTPGSRMFLYSDGINEALNLRKIQFGHERITSVLSSYKDKPLKKCNKNLISAVEDWNLSGNIFKDDVSIVSFERLK